MTSPKPTISYKDAGVDIDAGNALVEDIKPLAAMTKRSGVMSGLGGFGALFDVKAAGYKDPLLVSSTDGVGTKLKIAIEANQHSTVGIDLVAMCVNDLIVQGAEPLFFLDYFGTGHLAVNVARDVIAGIAEGCRQAGCALIGGETAELPGLYAKGDYDLAGFTVGAVERDQLLTGEDIKVGNVVIGLASSGVHSNGYSLVRKAVEAAGLQYDVPAPFAADKTLAAALLEPTRIYVPSCLAAVRAGLVKGFAHITGGGLLENIPRVLPDGVGVTLDANAWPLLPVFKWLQQTTNASSTELARTFNCGIGMVAIADADKADALMALLTAHGEAVYSIGRVTNGHGVTLQNADSAWQS